MSFAHCAKAYRKLYGKPFFIALKNTTRHTATRPPLQTRPIKQIPDAPAFYRPRRLKTCAFYCPPCMRGRNKNTRALRPQARTRTRKKPTHLAQYKSKPPRPHLQYSERSPRAPAPAVKRKCKNILLVVFCVYSTPALFVQAFRIRRATPQNNPKEKCKHKREQSRQRKPGANEILTPKRKQSSIQVWVKSIY